MCDPQQAKEALSKLWKPKYKEGDEVPIVLPKLTGYGLGFAAWGIVLRVNPNDETGVYKVKLTEILVDEYFRNKRKVGDCMALHFGNVELRDPEILKYMNHHKCFVFR